MKNEPISSNNQQSIKVKEEPIEVKDEKEEFANKISIAFLNEEETTNQATTSKSEKSK